AGRYSRCKPGRRKDLCRRRYTRQPENPVRVRNWIRARYHRLGILPRTGAAETHRGCKAACAAAADRPLAPIKLPLLRNWNEARGDALSARSKRPKEKAP